MQTKFIEATNGPHNWGKFMVARFDKEEWIRPSFVERRWNRGLVSLVGWTPQHIMVLDLQTGEGALFKPGGYAKADLDKHKIWVCPMFEPFLAWLYQQDVTDLETLPMHVDLPEAEFSLRGYRRAGV